VDEEEPSEAGGTAAATLRVVPLGNTLGLSCRALLESIGAERGDEVVVTVRKRRRRRI
jgi:hypothetical protein